MVLNVRLKPSPFGVRQLIASHASLSHRCKFYCANMKHDRLNTRRPVKTSYIDGVDSTSADAGSGSVLSMTGSSPSQRARSMQFGLPPRVEPAANQKRVGDSDVPLQLI